jgi:2-C-methyl-D-erythritol 4-phosphate cytidylyltransferase
MFKLGMLQTAIQQALNDNIEITDEASAIENVGYQPCVVEGNARNIKVTTAEDVTLAKMFMNTENTL